MRWGEVPNPPIDLAIVHPHHVSYPREMFPEIEAEEEVMEIDTKPRLHPVFYRSVIQPRDENQEEAFEALRVNRCGTSWQACGKGKTICSLNKIAESGAPAVVLVSNGGIAYQWKSRAMEFLGLAEEEIGLIQGNMGTDPYAYVPDGRERLFECLMNVDIASVSAIQQLDQYGPPPKEVKLLTTNISHLKWLFFKKLRLAPRSMAPNGDKPTVRRSDIVAWANDGVGAATAVLELLDLTRRRRALLAALLQNKRPHWMRKLVIVMLPTLVKRMHEIPMFIRQRFGTVICDESHHLPAPTFSTAASVFFGERFSMTATPERADGLQDIMYAHTGPVIYKDIVPDDPATVYVKGLDTELDMSDPWVADQVTTRSGGSSMVKLHQYLAEYEGRNRQIVRKVLNATQKGRRVLALAHSRQHPGILKSLFDRLSGNAYETCVVTGDTPPEERTALIATHQVTFATIGVATEGLDAPSLDTLFFVTPFSGWPIFVQGRGRIERLFEGKNPPIVVILMDPDIRQSANSAANLIRKMVHNGCSYES